MANISLLSGAGAAEADTTTVDTALQHPLGTKAVQSSNGNEYIYLQGVASTAAQDFVSFDEAHLTTRLVADAQGRVAIAQAAVLANQYGWYCIYGTVEGEVLASFGDNGKVYATATAGHVDDADVAGDAIVGVVGRAAIASGSAAMELNYPFAHDAAID